MKEIKCIFAQNYRYIMRKSLGITLALVFLCLTAPAQKVNKNFNTPIAKAFSDSLAELSASYFAYFKLWDDLNIPGPRKVIPNPAFYKLFVPTTLYEAPIREAFELKWTPDMAVMTAVDSLYAGKPSMTLYQPAEFTTYATADRLANHILLKYYVQHPDRIVNNERDLVGLKALDEKKIVKEPKKEKVNNLLKADSSVKDLKKENELLVVRPNFWTYSGNGYLQFTQNYISDNWYNGGESSNVMLSGLSLEAKYNDQQRIEFENKLEIKLGFLTSQSDTVHKFKTNTDVFDLTSKFGVKATTNWYYTLAAEFKTQLFPTYETNTDDLVSSFLSPAELDITLGMDYKRSKKNYSLSLLTSPLAYTFMYILDDDVTDPESFNVEEGHKSASLFGSKFTGALKWTIIPSVVWESKLDYFTTYDKVIASWENTFNFTLNRYLSTKFYVHVRYDDSVTLTDDNTTYFQMQELLSFGLNYTW